MKLFIEHSKGEKRFHANGDFNWMNAHYGYIEGTKGLDGDELDIYLGPAESDIAFVVLQMKAPDFRELDEYKIMLGYETASQAKEAYLSHYPDPRFFGGMFEIPKKDVDSLSVNKSLNKSQTSAKMRGPLVSTERIMSNKHIKKSINMLNDVTKRFTQLAKAASEAPIPEPMEKGMPANIASSIAKRQYRMHQHAAGQARPQPEVGTNRVRGEFEPAPVIPIRQVALEIPDGKGEVYKSCKCGYMYKSGRSCPKCAAAAKITESTDFRFPTS